MSDYLFTEQYANENRRGLRVCPHEYCEQYMAFCQGFCLHLYGHVDEALVYYSNSLQLGGEYSQNRTRLMALESIELIINEKASIERQADGGRQ